MSAPNPSIGAADNAVERHIFESSPPESDASASNDELVFDRENEAMRMPTACPVCGEMTLATPSVCAKRD